MAPPVLSVVIPAFDAADVIGRQLEALATQDWAGDWELVVADNGSTDGTRDRVERWAARLPLRVVDASARQGPGAARNLGAAETTGEWLVFCDADDEVSPGWLSAFASRFGDGDLVAGAIVHRRDDSTGPVPQDAPRLLGWLAYAQTANCAVRRTTFDATGGFREDLIAGEDVALSWDAQLQGARLVYCRDAVVIKEARSTHRDELRQYVSYGRADVQLARRYRPLGLPRADRRATLRAYGGLIARLPLLVWADRRGPWVRQAGRRLGRVLGSIELRTLLL